MMKNIGGFLVRHAKVTLIIGSVLLVGAAVYGSGIFSAISDGDDDFYATGTPGSIASKELREKFGSDASEASIILFEAKDRSADITSPEYTTEVQRILSTVSTTSTTSYYNTAATQFVSRDHHDTYAVVTLDGTNEEQYQELTDFADSTDSTLVDVSIGGLLVGRQQTQDQVKSDLAHVELISLPLLAILLFWFFRSVIASAIPLALSLCTILGALAVSRFLNIFFSLDSYTLNVVTILSVGLSIDYSLLAVNRFREELAHGKSPTEAAEKTAKTAGRTIFFSGLTVIVCLLALLFFPIGFMQSVSIGGAASVFVAAVISIVLLPPALRLIGTRIDMWSLKPRKQVSKGWLSLARNVTSHPYIALTVGIVIIASLVWPVSSFKVSEFDWRALPANQSAHHVGQVIGEEFDNATSSITLLATFDQSPSPEQLCMLAQSVGEINGVDSVQGAYAPVADSTSPLHTCTGLSMKVAAIARVEPQSAALLETTANKYVNGSTAKLDIVSKYGITDEKTRQIIADIENTSFENVIAKGVTGSAVRLNETTDAYLRQMPYAIGLIVLAMIIILGILLGSVILPIQATIINSIALFISLGVLVMIYQFGWGASLLHTTVTGGFDLSIPILILAIAFGLSMDYSVFLYSRMHEIYDLKNDPDEAIIQGVVKTGPIITAAALLLFVVVAAFITSKISMIQQIGIGLSVAVLVDAFFVRTILVPAIMKLFGRASWWAPQWLKKLTIRHE